eukprot:UN14273
MSLPLFVHISLTFEQQLRQIFQLNQQIKHCCESNHLC